jgi:hypothetical protein
MVVVAGFTGITRYTGAGTSLFQALFVAWLFIVPTSAHIFDDSLAIEELLEATESLFDGFSATEFHFTCCTCHILNTPSK